MAVRAELVEHVARLARLALSPDEIERFTAQLSDILDHFEALSTLPLEGADAVGGVAEGATPLRADLPGADPLQEAPAAFAPEWLDGFFTVPRLAALGGKDPEGA